MTRDELEKRIQTELAQPFWTAKGMADRDYTEAEFFSLKMELQNAWEDYMDSYVNYAENDV